jgi:hypothetical protein
VDGGIEPERGRGKWRFPVEEGLGEPWVPQVFDSEASRHLHHEQNRPSGRFCFLMVIIPKSSDLFPTKTRLIFLHFVGAGFFLIII